MTGTARGIYTGNKGRCVAGMGRLRNSAGAPLRFKVIRHERKYSYQPLINTPALRRCEFHSLALDASSIISRGDLYPPAQA